MLLNNFYKFDIKEVKEEEITAVVKINKEHDIFKGHFPDFPLVAGVCQVLMVKEIFNSGLKKFNMNIYIGNLNFTVDEEKLRTIFERYGEVNSVRIIKDKETGENKGYGFVEMKNNEEGKRAIQEMNSQEIDGKHIKVNIAKPRKGYYRKK